MSMRLHTLSPGGTSITSPHKPPKPPISYRSNQGKNSGCTKSLESFLPRKFNFFKLLPFLRLMEMNCQDLNFAPLANYFSNLRSESQMWGTQCRTRK